MAQIVEISSNGKWDSSLMRDRFTKSGTSRTINYLANPPTSMHRAPDIEFPQEPTNEKKYRQLPEPDQSIYRDYGFPFDGDLNEYEVRRREYSAFAMCHPHEVKVDLFLLQCAPWVISHCGTPAVGSVKCLIPASNWRLTVSLGCRIPCHLLTLAQMKGSPCGPSRASS